MNDMVKLQIGEGAILLPQNKVIQGLLASMGVPANDAPPVGEYWPGQGGVNAGLMRGVNGEPDYYLIVPTHADASFVDVPWGDTGEEIAGAACEFDGMKNTLAIIGAEGEHPAAEKCRSLCIEGHRDFYLPARRELSLCYANVPELFEKRWHWSSTQCSAHTAWGQGFADGLQGDGHKDLVGRVRAVRRLTYSSI